MVKPLRYKRKWVEVRGSHVMYYSSEGRPTQGMYAREDFPRRATLFQTNVHGGELGDNADAGCASARLAPQANASH